MAAAPSCLPMKLATYHDGSRDGHLVVVSRDLSTAHFANGIASRLQTVLDDWAFLAPQLQDLYTTLNHGKARHAFPFEPGKCMAPLPRAGQWVQVLAYPSHAERLLAARGETLPDGLRGQPLVLRGAGDGFLGPCADAVLARSEWGIDFEAGLAVVTGDIDTGATPAQALDGVRLLMLANSWRLRSLPEGAEPLPWSAEAALHQPQAGFSPVAVTSDELAEAWHGGRVKLPLQTQCNGRKLGQCDAGADMSLHFGQLLASLARVRPLRAGSVVGTGPVSNRDVIRGTHCLAERRALEQLEGGEARTGWLQFGDTVRIEMKGRDGLSVFGAIEQTVADPA